MEEMGRDLKVLQAGNIKRMKRPGSGSNKLKRGPQEEATQLMKQTSSSKTTQTRLVASLHSAANEGKVELVRLLLRCGAEVNAQDEQFGNTALHQAAWNGFSETVHLLCKYRANTSIRNKAQFTPLHMAAQQGHNQSARLLLMANAKTEAKNSYGDTPLHTAARYGHAGVARILLSAKCNPKQVNKNHDTPLHIAAAMGRRKLTKILMQNGAELAIKNKQNETAMDIALRKDLIDIQELIANPPPAKSSSSAALQQQAANEQIHLSQLEQRYGQLYTASNAMLNRHHKQKHHRLPVAKQVASSDEELESGDEELNEKFACIALHRRGKELPVDVGSEQQVVKPSTGSQRLITRKGGFSSVNSLTSQRPKPAQTSSSRANHQRATIDHQDLKQVELLKMLPALRRKQNGSLNCGSSEVCLPDARDSPREWADIMAKSAQCGKDTTVIDVDSTSNKLDQSSTKADGSASPAGSGRSSLSKSRGRLVVRRRTRQKTTLLPVRRPNLGTCVGKLSLLRLRTMVNDDKKEDSEVDDDDDEQEQVEEEQQQTKPVAAGRREERLNRLREEQSNGFRASNGNQLRATRPLASLDNTQLYAIPKKTSLLGKSEVVVKQQQVTNSVSNAKQQQQVAGEGANEQRVPSGGPALTSDGGHSSNSSASSFARVSPPISSSAIGSSTCSLNEEPSTRDAVCVNVAEKEQQTSGRQPGQPAVVGVHVDGDLYAGPGYSTVGGGTNDGHSDDEPCLCRPAAKEISRAEQHMVGADERNLNGAPFKLHENGSGSCKRESSTNDSSQQGSQQVASGRMGKGSHEIRVSKASKLRQLLHLDLRPKESSMLHNSTPEVRNNQKTVASTDVVIANTDDAGGKTNTFVDESQSGFRLMDNNKLALSKPLPMSAVAGGYYSYSPVVQSNSELLLLKKKKKEPPASKAKDSLNEKSKSLVGNKKSWLKSKFSLSNGNLNHQHQQVVDSKKETTKVEVADMSVSSSALPAPPERKAELITIGTAQGLETPKEIDNERNLIRPKSAISATNADLIAAQKSLALAAAAKVKQDKLGRCGGVSTSATEATLRSSITIPGSKENSSLTVDTESNGNIPFWRHIGQPTLGNMKNIEQKYMIGQPLTVNSHRSGTNSVGMSDSSPSNNGADSDNSLQTTTGSMNTDSGVQANSEMNNNLSSSPLGLLSRILLNNKNISRASQQQQQQRRQPVEKSENSPQGEDSTELSGNTTLHNDNVGSSLSSSTLSSPSISHNGQTNQKLDQLSSRSRRPIVLTRSNELTSTAKESSEKDTCGGEGPELPPRLPSKSVLKVSGSFEGCKDGSHLINQALPEQHINGLPRVASYTHVQSSEWPQTQAANSSYAAYKQSLCNYHALNQRNPMYGPYLPFSLGYPVHQEQLTKYPSMRHHLSHHDLSKSLAQRGDNQTSAVNYEYYLDGPLPINTSAYQQHQRLQPYLCNDNNPIYSHDDSLYLSYANATQIRDTNTNQQTILGGQQATVHNSDFGIVGKPFYYHHNLANHQKQQRPKSSLDGFLLSSANSKVASIIHPNPIINYGQRLSATQQLTTNCQLNDIRSLDSTAHHQNHDVLPIVPNKRPLVGPNSDKQYPIADNTSAMQFSPDSSSSIATHHYYTKNHPFSTSYMNGTTTTSNTTDSYLYPENTIYASDQNTVAFHKSSNLTVLPTTIASVNSSPTSSSSYKQQTTITTPMRAPNGVSNGHPSDSNEPNSATIQMNPNGSTPETSQNLRTKLHQEKNSWKPIVHKSLVQVNQSSPSLKLNQYDDHDQPIKQDKGSEMEKTVEKLQRDVTDANNATISSETQRKFKVLINGGKSKEDDHAERLEVFNESLAIAKNRLLEECGTSTVL